MKPRKAKLRMWMIKDPACGLVGAAFRTKRDLLADHFWGDLNDRWLHAQKQGYRAVRVTVTEDTNGR